MCSEIEVSIGRSLKKAKGEKKEKKEKLFMAFRGKAKIFFPVRGRGGVHWFSRQINVCFYTPAKLDRIALVGRPVAVVVCRH